MDHYRPDNTTGYTQAELDQMNAELTALLSHVAPHSDAWYAAIKRHNDTVAGR